jgi:hypothetical protein
MKEKIKALGTEIPELVWQELNSSRADAGVFNLGWTVHRSKVPGGWLVLVLHNTSGLTFYPDPGHQWDGGSMT